MQIKQNNTLYPEKSARYGYILSVDRQSIDMSVACRSIVDRVTIDISTDASIDISTEVPKRYMILLD